MMEKLIIFGVFVVVFIATIMLVDYSDNRGRKQSKKPEKRMKECDDCWGGLDKQCKRCGGTGEHE